MTPWWRRRRRRSWRGWRRCCRRWASRHAFRGCQSNASSATTTTRPSTSLAHHERTINDTRERQGRQGLRISAMTPQQRLLPENHTLHDTGVHGDGPVHRRRAEPSSCSATSSAVSRCRQHPVRRRRRHRPLRRVACAVARPAAWPPPARTWPRLEPGLGRSRPEPKMERS
ncbi:hypothetical protein EMIHUDRAFT_437265 [Emiliania huxleyi CCMP1516]|uniref:Uncharacterized protein n=2 Tax=Emiliania huxleyi TaxID=2903 RepID=A0A0D3IMU4_EMIH1|nr:hypothetical protein EMIHUDRAFT_437265 [Emiliania huxleyi CCMP1516]EOD12579.1 hypothetical protein EMIHUDRAFT_437265 [Emiliania huxleyi CCMP1516]|eukprot:XP_005765008.1 hypothetical protein EMIHUDRAFT_437265 [Emiliania huxleyi CCMP1516]